jgi:transposase
VKLSTAVKAGIRALLAKHNIRLSATQLESDAATGLLDALALPGTYAIRLASQRRLMLVLADEIASVEVDLHGRLRGHPGYRNLLTVKGIGPILAATFVAEIGDVARFPTASALCCWAGLTPRHYESDKTLHRGHISKEGDPLARLGCGRGDPAPDRTHRQSRQGRDRGPPREGRPQHRQGRRRPADARGRLLRAARRPSPLPHDGSRGMSTTRTSCRPGNAMTHLRVRSRN